MIFAMIGLGWNYVLYIITHPVILYPLIGLGLITLVLYLTGFLRPLLTGFSIIRGLMKRKTRS